MRHTSPNCTGRCDGTCKSTEINGSTTALLKPLPGSTSDSGHSVTHLKNRTPTKIRKILVPLEVDSRSELLLGTASSFAKQMGAQLVLLHVCKVMSFLPPLATAAQFEEWNEAVHRIAGTKFSEMLTHFREDPVVQAASTVVVPGLLEEEVIRTASLLDVDLIILSTHAYHGMKHVFYGSKAEVILRHSPCPVLMIPLAEPFDQAPHSADQESQPRARSEQLAVG